MKEIDKILGIPSTTPVPQKTSADSAMIVAHSGKQPDISPEEKARLQVQDVEEQLRRMEENKIDKDFDEARHYIQKSLDVAHDAIERIILLAGETEKAQYYEVLNKFLATMSSNSKDLLELYEKKNKAKGLVRPKDSQPQINNSTVTNINNAVFTGTPKDLKRLVDAKEITIDDKENDT